MSKEEPSLDSLAKTIAGEIVLSENPGQTIQKWRTIFKVPQRQLADKMGVMPSVISDYESGRRKSPGVRLIQRTVRSLLELDVANGGTVIMGFNSFAPNEVLSDAILDMKECKKPVTVSDISKFVNGEIVIGASDHEKKVLGYSIVDSLKVILALSGDEIARLHYITTDRALVFTNATSGKSHLIAIKLLNIKPRVIIFHNINKIDSLAQRIAEAEEIPIIISKMKTIDELISAINGGCC